jgi:hypothetical protein
LRRWERDQRGDRQRKTPGSRHDFPAGQQIPALRDDPAPAAQNFT